MGTANHNSIPEMINRKDCRKALVDCSSPNASSPYRLAASILHQNGITKLIEMAGGLAAWDAAHTPAGRLACLTVSRENGL
jgi:rhodanese-related sulfurtransferase